MDDDILQAEMDRFVDDGSLDDNVDSFLSQDDADPRDRVNRCADVTKGTININKLLQAKKKFSTVVFYHDRSGIKGFANSQSYFDVRLHFFGGPGYSCKYK